jgi:hypothetical protein
MKSVLMWAVLPLLLVAGCGGTDRTPPDVRAGVKVKLYASNGTRYGTYKVVEVRGNWVRCRKSDGDGFWWCNFDNVLDYEIVE